MDIFQSSFDPTTPQAFLISVYFVCSLKRSQKESVCITMKMLSPDPYGQKYVRKLVDTCAFRMYGHWVKRGEQQNRAALFETNPHTLSGVAMDATVLKLFYEEPVNWMNFA